jgi:histidyl-tRNA synthetase
MAEQRKFQAIKGVRDILPPESALWNRVEQTAREVFATYGYGEIRLPIFEQTELFARSIGAETEVVEKEMYTFEDGTGKSLEQFRRLLLHWLPRSAPNDFLQLLKNFLIDTDIAFTSGEIPQADQLKVRISQLHKEYEGLKALLDSCIEPEELERNIPLRVVPDVAGRRVQEGPQWNPWVSRVGILLGGGISFADVLTLRPEATASVCRAYIEHGMHTLPGNVKLYYIGPMFRRERPQKGRYRQFYQIGAEVLGQSDAPAIDAEVIEMLLAFFDRCGLAGYETHVNSIGCKECRPKYVEKLRAALVEHINELKADSQRRVETNPLRVLDSKLPEEQAVIEKLPRISDNLCPACREHYVEVKKQLALRGVAYKENWRLVRGLDYYMRTTFEITAPGLGAQNAVCGGGRYDGLVELLGGQPTKGIGFAIGTDRLILSLQGGAQQAAPLQRLDVFIAWMGAASQPAAVKMARTLREAGFSVEVPAEEMKFKKSFGLADKLCARYALIIGENEIAEGKYALKRLADGVQEKVGAEELVERLKN